VSIGLDRRAAAQAADRLWRWWASEIAGLAPARLRRLWRSWRRDLEILFDGSALTLSLRQGERYQDIGKLAFTSAAPEATGAALRTLVETSSESYDRLLLKIDESRLLRRTLRLPLAARRDLVEALEYDIDRQTPFTAEDVYYGCRERRIDTETGEIEAELTVIRRSDLDPLIEALNAAGLSADCSDGSVGGPDLRPPRVAPRPSALLRPSSPAALAASAVLLAALGTILPLARVAETRIALEQRLAQTRSEALAVDRVRQEVRTLEDKRMALFARKAGEPSVLSMIEELTRAVPMDAFVTELTVEAGEITISGYAQKASEVLGAVETAPHFDSARFLAPVTQDRRLGRERFSLAARILVDSGEDSGGDARAETEAAMP